MCHNTTSTPSLKTTVSINTSTLIPHLQEPELWVHHVDASPVKTLKHGASSAASSSITSQTQAAPLWDDDQKCKKKKGKKCIRSAKQWSKKTTKSAEKAGFCSCSCRQRVCLAFLFRVNRWLPHTCTHTKPLCSDFTKKWCHSWVKSVNPLSLGIVSLIM